MAIYGQRSINGSVKWLVVPDSFCNTGLAWTDNLLVPEARCGYRGTVETWTLGTQFGVHFGGVHISLHGAVLFCAVDLPRSPENSRATAHCVCDIHLREHRLAQAQHLLYAHHIGSDEQVNQYYDNWDSWVDQFFWVKYPLVV